MELNYPNQISNLEEKNRILMEDLNAVKRMKINDNPIVPIAPSFPEIIPLNNIDYPKHQELQTLTGHNSNVFSLLKVSENLIASGSADKTIKLWKREDGNFNEIQILNELISHVYPA